MSEHQPDPLFDALRDRLGAHQRAPAPATWEALAAQLQHRRRRRAAWRWFGGGTALLGLVVMLMWLRLAPPSLSPTDKTRRAVAAAATGSPPPSTAHAPAKDRAVAPAANPENAPSGQAAPASVAGTTPPAAAAPSAEPPPTAPTTVAPTAAVPTTAVVPTTAGTVVPVGSGTPGPALAGEVDSTRTTTEARPGQERRQSPRLALAIHPPVIAPHPRLRHTEQRSATRSSGSATTAPGAATPTSGAATKPSGSATPASATVAAASGSTDAGSALAPAVPPRTAPLLLDTLTPVRPVVVVTALARDTAGVQPVPTDTTHRAAYRPSRWAFGLWVGAGLTHRRLGAGATPLARAESPALAGQGQLAVRYGLTPRLFVSTGVGYAVYRQQLSATVVRSPQQLRYVLHTETDATGQVRQYYVWENVPVTTDSAVVRTPVRQAQSIRYLTLPVLLEWHPRFRAVRWQPVLAGGVTINRLLGGRMATLNPACDCETSAADLRPWGVGLSAAVGVDYALRPDFWLQVRPAATYLLTSTTRPAAPARYPFSATLQVGLRWTPARRPAADH